MTASESSTIDAAYLDVPRLSAYRKGDKRIIGIHLHGIVTYVEMDAWRAASLARILGPEEERVAVADDGGEDG